MSFLFLYTELADYFLKCCEALAAHGEVHVVRWPVNKEAPFSFSFPKGVTVYSKSDLPPEKLRVLMAELRPRMIVCSGWIDRDYLKAIKPWSGKVPTVLALDTHWTGTLKQQAARLLSPFILHRRFSHAWVPGTPQAQYARKLGFRIDRIHRGFYSCDLARFNRIYAMSAEGKAHKFPRRFIFAGRYYTFKGIEDLWKAFASLTEEERNGWELWCLGTGSVEPARHPHVRHFGFVQPSALAGLLDQAGVFVLPSHFEPWGVVVHEFAAAGFPLILSDAVGAGEAFLDEERNGARFRARSVDQLRSLLKKMAALSDKDLLLMAAKSHELAQANSPEKWANTAVQICDGWNE